MLAVCKELHSDREVTSNQQGVRGAGVGRLKLGHSVHPAVSSTPKDQPEGRAQLHATSISKGKGKGPSDLCIPSKIYW